MFSFHKIKDNVEYRVETDSMGEIKVRNDVYWGAQTQRFGFESLLSFNCF